MSETLAPPTRLADLVAWLDEHRFCELTDPFGQVEIVRFMRAADGGLWFAGETRNHYLPVRCGLAGDRSETGVTLDPGGFTLSKFGKDVRLKYLTS